MALDDLTRYESAGIAASNSGKEKGLAVLAMENQYRLMHGKDFDDDPIMKRVFGEARAGLVSDNISHTGLLEAMQIYSGKYNKTFVSTKLSDLVKYLSEGYKISDEVKEALGKYSDLTLKDLGEKAKDKELPKEDAEKIAKAINAIEMLKDRRLRAKTMDMYNEFVKRNLAELYPKEEDKEKDK